MNPFPFERWIHIHLDPLQTIESIFRDIHFRLKLLFFWFHTTSNSTRTQKVDPFDLNSFLDSIFFIMKFIFFEKKFREYFLKPKFLIKAHYFIFTQIFFNTNFHAWLHSSCWFRVNIRSFQILLSMCSSIYQATNIFTSFGLIT